MKKVSILLFTILSLCFKTAIGQFTVGTLDVNSNFSGPADINNIDVCLESLTQTISIFNFSPTNTVDISTLDLIVDVQLSEVREVSIVNGNYTRNGNVLDIDIATPTSLAPSSTYNITIIYELGCDLSFSNLPGVSPQFTIANDANNDGLFDSQIDTDFFSIGYGFNPILVDAILPTALSSLYYGIDDDLVINAPVNLLNGGTQSLIVSLTFDEDIGDFYSSAISLDFNEFDGTPVDAVITGPTPNISNPDRQVDFQIDFSSPWQFSGGTTTDQRELIFHLKVIACNNDVADDVTIKIFNSCHGHTNQCAAGIESSKGWNTIVTQEATEIVSNFRIYNQSGSSDIPLTIDGACDINADASFSIEVYNPEAINVPGNGHKEILQYNFDVDWRFIRFNEIQLRSSDGFLSDPINITLNGNQFTWDCPTDNSEQFLNIEDISSNGDLSQVRFTFSFVENNINENLLDVLPITSIWHPGNTNSALQWIDETQNPSTFGLLEGHSFYLVCNEFSYGDFSGGLLRQCNRGGNNINGVFVSLGTNITRTRGFCNDLANEPEDPSNNHTIERTTLGASVIPRWMDPVGTCIGYDVDNSYWNGNTLDMESNTDNGNVDLVPGQTTLVTFDIDRGNANGFIYGATSFNPWQLDQTHDQAAPLMQPDPLNGNFWGVIQLPQPSQLGDNGVIIDQSAAFQVRLEYEFIEFDNNCNQTITSAFSEDIIPILVGNNQYIFKINSEPFTNPQLNGEQVLNLNSVTVAITPAPPLPGTDLCYVQAPPGNVDLFITAYQCPFSPVGDYFVTACGSHEFLVHPLGFCTSHVGVPEPVPGTIYPFIIERSSFGFIDNSLDVQIMSIDPNNNLLDQDDNVIGTRSDVRTDIVYPMDEIHVAIVGNMANTTSPLPECGNTGNTLVNGNPEAFSLSPVISHRNDDLGSSLIFIEGNGTHTLEIYTDDRSPIGLNDDLSDVLIQTIPINDFTVNTLYNPITENNETQIIFNNAVNMTIFSLLETHGSLLFRFQGKLVVNKDAFSLTAEPQRFSLTLLSASYEINPGSSNVTCDPRTAELDILKPQISGLEIFADFHEPGTTYDNQLVADFDSRTNACGRSFILEQSITSVTGEDDWGEFEFRPWLQWPDDISFNITNGSFDGFSNQHENNIRFQGGYTPENEFDLYWPTLWDPEHLQNGFYVERYKQMDNINQIANGDDAVLTLSSAYSPNPIMDGSNREFHWWPVEFGTQSMEVFVRRSTNGAAVVDLAPASQANFYIGNGVLDENDELDTKHNTQSAYSVNPSGSNSTGAFRRALDITITPVTELPNGLTWGYPAEYIIDFGFDGIPDQFVENTWIVLEDVEGNITNVEISLESSETDYNAFHSGSGFPQWPGQVGNSRVRNSPIAYNALYQDVQNTSQWMGYLGAINGIGFHTPTNAGSFSTPNNARKNTYRLKVYYDCHEDMAGDTDYDLPIKFKIHTGWDCHSTVEEMYNRRFTKSTSAMPNNILDSAADVIPTNRVIDFVESVLSGSNVNSVQFWMDNVANSYCGGQSSVEYDILPTDIAGVIIGCGTAVNSTNDCNLVDFCNGDNSIGFNFRNVLSSGDINNIELTVTFWDNLFLTEDDEAGAFANILDLNLSNINGCDFSDALTLSNPNLTITDNIGDLPRNGITNGVQDYEFTIDLAPLYEISNACNSGSVPQQTEIELELIFQQLNSISRRVGDITVSFLGYDVCDNATSTINGSLTRLFEYNNNCLPCTDPSVLFDGKSSYVRVNPTTSNPPPGFSSTGTGFGAEAMIRPDFDQNPNFTQTSTNVNTISTVFSRKNGTGNSRTGISFGVTQDLKQLYFEVENSGTGNDVFIFSGTNSAIDFSDGICHHIGVSVNSSGVLSFFFDGIQINGTHNVAFNNIVGQIMIGRSVNNSIANTNYNTAFAGEISNVRIFNAPLNPQLLTYYNQDISDYTVNALGFGSNPNDIVGLWKMDEGINSSLGNNNQVGQLVEVNQNLPHDSWKKGVFGNSANNNITTNDPLWTDDINSPVQLCTSCPCNIEPDPGISVIYDCLPAVNPNDEIQLSVQGTYSQVIWEDIDENAFPDMNINDLSLTYANGPQDGSELVFATPVGTNGCTYPQKWKEVYELYADIEIIGDPSLCGDFCTELTIAPIISNTDLTPDPFTLLTPNAWQLNNAPFTGLSNCSNGTCSSNCPTPGQCIYTNQEGTYTATVVTGSSGCHSIVDLDVFSCGTPVCDALIFDGIENMVRLDFENNLPTADKFDLREDFTVSMRFRAEGRTGPAEEYTLFYKGNNFGNTYLSIGLSDNRDNIIVKTRLNTPSTIIADASLSLSATYGLDLTDGCHTIIASKTATDIDIYVDGVFIYTASIDNANWDYITSSTNIPYNQILQVGRSRRSNDLAPFKGEISNLALWKTYIDQATVDLYTTNCINPYSYSDIYAFFPMNEGNNTQELVDVKGNWNNNGVSGPSPAYRGENNSIESDEDPRWSTDECETCECSGEPLVAQTIDACDNAIIMISPETVNNTMNYGAPQLYDQFGVLVPDYTTGNINYPEYEILLDVSNSPYNYYFANCETTSPPEVIIPNTTIPGAQVTINVANPLIGNIQVTDASCNGSTDGSITFDITGLLVGPGKDVQISWTGGSDIIEDPATSSINYTIPSLGFGTYIISVTQDVDDDDDFDGDDCMSNQITEEVKQPDLMSTIHTTVSPTCNGFSNGTITITDVQKYDADGNLITPSGFPSGFTFDWSDGVTTGPVFTGPAGMHTVTITDLNNGNCQNNVVIEILEGDEISITYDKIDVLCFGENTGSIDITDVFNGTVSGSGNYQFDWTADNGFTPLQTSQTLIENLSAGTYTVIVTDLGNLDADGSTPCDSDPINISITEPNQPLSLAATSIIDETCPAGTNDGSIDITVTGGTAPYTYLWSNNDNTEDVTNLSPNDYTVTITDANGCSITSPTYTVNACASCCPGGPLQVETMYYRLSVDPSSAGTTSVFSLDDIAANWGVTALSNHTVTLDIEDIDASGNPLGTLSPITGTPTLTGTFNHNWSTTPNQTALFKYLLTVTADNAAGQSMIFEIESVIPATFINNYHPLVTPVVPFSSVDPLQTTFCGDPILGLAGNFTNGDFWFSNISITTNGNTATDATGFQVNAPAIPFGQIATMDVVGEGLFTDFEISGNIQDNLLNMSYTQIVDMDYKTTCLPVCTQPLTITETCNNQIATLTASPGFDNYFWPHDGSTTQSVVITAPGQYQVDVSGVGGSNCVASATIQANGCPCPPSGNIIPKGIAIGTLPYDYDVSNPNNPIVSILFYDIINYEDLTQLDVTIDMPGVQQDATYSIADMSSWGGGQYELTHNWNEALNPNDNFLMTITAGNASGNSFTNQFYIGDLNPNNPEAIEEVDNILYFPNAVFPDNPYQMTAGVEDFRLMYTNNDPGGYTNASSISTTFGANSTNPTLPLDAASTDNIDFKLQPENVDINTSYTVNATATQVNGNTLSMTYDLSFECGGQTTACCNGGELVSETMYYLMQPQSGSGGTTTILNIQDLTPFWAVTTLNNIQNISLDIEDIDTNGIPLGTLSPVNGTPVIGSDFTHTWSTIPNPNSLFMYHLTVTALNDAGELMEFKIESSIPPIELSNFAPLITLVAPPDAMNFGEELLCGEPVIGWAIGFNNPDITFDNINTIANGSNIMGTGPLNINSGNETYFIGTGAVATEGLSDDFFISGTIQDNELNLSYDQTVSLDYKTTCGNICQDINPRAVHLATYSDGNDYDMIANTSDVTIGSFGNETIENLTIKIENGSGPNAFNIYDLQLGNLTLYQNNDEGETAHKVYELVHQWNWPNNIPITGKYRMMIEAISSTGLKYESEQYIYIYNDNGIIRSQYDLVLYIPYSLISLEVLEGANYQFLNMYRNITPGGVSNFNSSTNIFDGQPSTTLPDPGLSTDDYISQFFYHSLQPSDDILEISTRIDEDNGDYVFEKYDMYIECNYQPAICSGSYIDFDYLFVQPGTVIDMDNGLWEYTIHLKTNIPNVTSKINSIDISFETLADNIIQNESVDVSYISDNEFTVVYDASNSDATEGLRVTIDVMTSINMDYHLVYFQGADLNSGSILNVYPDAINYGDLNNGFNDFNYIGSTTSEFNFTDLNMSFNGSFLPPIPLSNESIFEGTLSELISSSGIYTVEANSVSSVNPNYVMELSYNLNLKCLDLVLSDPNCSLSATINQIGDICLGPLTLDATISGGNGGAISYSWFPNAYVDDNYVEDAVVNPPSTINYRLFVYEPGCGTYTTTSLVQVPGVNCRVISNDESGIKAELDLNGNQVLVYPNPSSNNFNFDFRLSENSMVSLKVYDLRGKLIESLIQNESYDKGTHNVTFEANKFASGSYIFQLFINDSMESGELILIK